MEPFSLTQGKYFITNKSYKESFTMPNIRNNINISASASATPNSTTPDPATPDPAIPDSATTDSATPDSATTDPATTDDTQEAVDLQAKMEDLLTRLQKAQTDEASFTTKFSTSVNANDTNTNTYLNKNIHFSNVDRYGYVTNQSELKMYTSNDLFEKNKGKHGCPTDFIEAGFSFPTDPAPKLGQSIETDISSVFVALGLPITRLGESCGYEGQNVYVNKLITNTTATYQGCYTNNSTTFIGGDPPVAETFITNNNFSQSQIANDSYKYLSWDTITVPGWNFNCFLVNNSSAWGYPTPYPNGNQCASIQMTQELWSDWMSFSPGVTYTISFDACGRNCCDGSGEANPINVGVEYTTFYSFTPPVNKWTKYSTTFTVDSQGSKRLSFKGTWTASDRSTAIQNVSINKGASSNSGGTYTYDMCKQAAIDNGYHYFGLQNVNTETKTGYCSVGNDAVGVSQKGTSFAVNKIIPLWDTKTNGSGQTVSLTNQGTLSVYDSAGTSIYNTDNSTAQPSNYLGCYGDSGARAMPYLQSGNQVYDLTKCQQKATDNGAAPYFGLQNSTSGTNAQCWLSSWIDGIRKYGKATNCTKLSDGTYSGGGWSNAIYSLDPSSFYYLILQDDGNMCIYRGSGPNDYQGTIWCSMTTGKQQKPNPAMTAEKSKYGKNWISSGSTLSAGEFVGSTDGSIYLIMQGDGNLVLYTSSVGENCSIIDSINYQDIYGGGIGANALYKLDKVAFPGNMGKNGYVNGGSRLSEYPADMMTFEYSEPIQNKIGRNVQMIPGYNWTDGTIDDATTACNNEPTCNTILTHTSMPGKYLIAKGSTTDLTDANGYTSILKTNTVDKTQINSTCNKQSPIGIDTIQWEHYLKGLPMTKDTKCSIGKLESLKGKTIADLKSQLTDVSSKLIDKLNKIEDKNNKMNAQMDVGGKQIRIDVKKYKENAQKILTYSKSMNPRRKNDSQTLEGFNVLNNNIDYMVSDSNIVSTQGIYSYIIWSVIATVTVIITIELFTNERNTPLWKLVFLSVIIIIMNGLFREYALLVNILIVLMFVIMKKFKLMAKENNNV